jgi:hypothetical protein
MNNNPHVAIVDVEERLRQAMLKSDVTALDELIAPELIFTNHFGQLVTKQDDLAIHRSGALKLQALVPSEQHIHIHNGCAVVSVLMHLVGSYESAPIDLSIRYTRIWTIPKNGSMQIIAVHAGIVSVA